MSGPQRVVLGAWLAMVGLATARSFASGKGMPQPGTYLASGVLFTLLYGAASVVGPLAAVFAVGTDLAALLTPYLRGQPGLLDQLGAALSKMDGSGQPQGAAPGGGTGNLAP